MALPEDPPTFRQPNAAERPWWWRLEDAAGNEVTLASGFEEYADARFANQADAESWVGEVWSELAEGGVTHVTLFEIDREVYGPMSLSV